MEITDFFETELDLTQPVDTTKIIKEEKKNEKAEEGEKGVQKVTPDDEYEIIDVLDKNDEKLGGDDEEEIEKPEEDTKKKPSDQSASSSEFPYSTLAKALYEEGILSFFDEKKFKEIAEESGSELDALFEMVKMTVDEHNDAYKNSLSPEGKAFLEALESGVPLDKYISVKTSQFKYDSIKEDKLADDEELCKSLIREDLLAKGFDEDEIKEQIKDIDDLGKLDVKAKVALKRLKATQAEQLENERLEARKREQAAIEHNKKQMAAIKTKIDGTEEIIPGVKLNAKMKGELYAALTTPAEQLENGQWINAVYAKRMKDPVAWDIKLAYLDKIGVFDGKWDKLISGAKSTATKELTEKLKAGTIAKTGEPGSPEASPKAKDILASMEKTFRRKEQY